MRYTSLARHGTEPDTGVWCPLAALPDSVTVSTTDFDSVRPGSNPGRVTGWSGHLDRARGRGVFFEVAVRRITIPPAAINDTFAVTAFARTRATWLTRSLSGEGQLRPFHGRMR